MSERGNMEAKVFKTDSKMDTQQGILESVYTFNIYEQSC